MIEANVRGARFFGEWQYSPEAFPRDGQAIPWIGVRLIPWSDLMITHTHKAYLHLEKRNQGAYGRVLPSEMLQQTAHRLLVPQDSHPSPKAHGSGILDEFIEFALDYGQYLHAPYKGIIETCHQSAWRRQVRGEGDGFF